MFISDPEYFLNVVVNTTKSAVSQAVIDKDSFYKSFDIPKKDGVRHITAIDKKSLLYKLQSALVRNFFEKLPIPKAAKGFIKGHSYNDFLREHIGKKYFLRIDIKDFFGSITLKHMHDIFSEYIKDEYALKSVCDICTVAGKLPQGAVSSPAISNIIFSRIDQRITKYCQKIDITYTRYADDLMFSSDKYDFKNQVHFYRKIKYILNKNGFRCNYSKKRISQESVSLSGYVVEKDVHLSRKKLNGINKVLYYFGKCKDYSENKKYRISNIIFENPDWLKDLNSMGILDYYGRTKCFENVYQLINYLAGYRSFLISVIKANECPSPKIVQLKHKIIKIEKLLDVLSQKFDT